MIKLEDQEFQQQARHAHQGDSRAFKDEIEIGIAPLDDGASDEVLFANPETISVIVEELLGLRREMSENPAIVDEERKTRGLLEDLQVELLKDVTNDYTEGVEAGIWDPNGGGDAATADFGFCTQAGQMEGGPAELKVEDFWYLGPLDAAKAKLGG